MPGYIPSPSKLRKFPGERAEVNDVLAPPAWPASSLAGRALLDDYNIEVGGGFGELRGKIWRIGPMGDSAREANVFTLLSALEIVLSKQGYEVAYGLSLAVAQQALAEFERIDRRYKSWTNRLSRKPIPWWQR